MGACWKNSRPATMASSSKGRRRHRRSLLCVGLGWTASMGTANALDELFTRYDPGAYTNSGRYPRGGDNYHDTRCHIGGCPDGADWRSSSTNEVKQFNRRRRRRDQSSPYHNGYGYDDGECTTHLAPSSIPAAGMGIFTSVPYERGEAFPLPDIGVMLRRRPRSEDRKSVFDQYTWASHALDEQVTVGSGYDEQEREVASEAVIPGIGTMANCHLGMVNFRRAEAWKVLPHLDGTRSLGGTAEDVSSGAARSPHGHVVLESTGEELFVSYGNEWFRDREHMYGPMPEEEHYEKADELLQMFANEVVSDDDDDSSFEHPLWNATYQDFLREVEAKNRHVRVALPNQVKDVPAALEVGNARHSTSKHAQSVESLRESGSCLDGIASGSSTIPHAGNGAFATRLFQHGETITTTPMIAVGRDELLVDEEESLLLNYCYGHPESSLLFFPYAPSVNSINHGGVNGSNAEIRWSTLPHHRAEWLNATSDEMKQKMESGLLFDIVATRDIRRGEEILLDYGNDWEAKWNKQIENLGPRKVMVNYGVNPHHHHTSVDRVRSSTVPELNNIKINPVLRTKAEQQLDDPYPSHARDDHASGVFRQAIGLPDVVLPPHWMDLRV